MLMSLAVSDAVESIAKKRMIYLILKQEQYLFFISYQQVTMIFICLTP